MRLNGQLGGLLTQPYVYESSLGFSLLGIDLRIVLAERLYFNDLLIRYH